eukprot:TRINITY_DN29112_c0_g1_i1.p1 TRINITY_DN29112_c0_g1~~TRINITY_DN29112_c0_g1_i1.p1  ORF type:complete len:511 (+),score=39.13 TRINITY_DN29112_c0_g1_i1:107-1639(+)
MAPDRPPGDCVSARLAAEHGNRRLTKKRRISCAADLATQVKHATNGAVILDTSDAGGGRCLRAARDFQAGEVLFEEEPLLKCRLVTSPSDLQKLAMKSFANERVREVVEQLHDAEGMSSLRIAELDALASLARSCETRRWLRKFLRAFELNVFLYHDDFSAMFLAGSFFNHACSPNALYTTLPTKKLVTFRAVRSITCGDEVTLCYQAGLTVERRRRYLRETKLFDCWCRVCSSPDPARAIWCPGEDGCTGVVLPCAQKAGIVAIWACQSCGQQLIGAEARLEVESILSDLAVDHKTHHNDYPREHFVAVMFVAAVLLSPRHWTVRYMVDLLIPSTVSRMKKGDNLSKHAAAQLIRLTRFVLVWRTHVAPAMKRSGSVYSNQMLWIIRELWESGLSEVASEFAKHVYEDYRCIWGNDDHDTVFLRDLAVAAAGHFSTAFDWLRWEEAIGDMRVDPTDKREGESIASAIAQVLEGSCFSTQRVIQEPTSQAVCCRIVYTAKRLLFARTELH